MSRIDRDRRKFLAAGSTAAAISLAGCSSVLLNRIGGDGGGEDGGDGGDGGGGGGGGGGASRGENVPEAVHSFLTNIGSSGAALYEGEAEDMTGSSEVTVEVGAGDNGLAFGPPAILVDSGTSIVWEWTGNGGGHNVVSAEDSAMSFNSGEAVSEAGTTFSQTFDSAGNQLYYCSPHQAVGMAGAVIVQG